MATGRRGRDRLVAGNGPGGGRRVVRRRGHRHRRRRRQVDGIAALTFRILAGHGRTGGCDGQQQPRGRCGHRDPVSSHHHGAMSSRRDPNSRCRNRRRRRRPRPRSHHR